MCKFFQVCLYVNFNVEFCSLGIRNRFTEFYMGDLTNKRDLVNLVQKYLENLGASGPEVESGMSV